MLRTLALATAATCFAGLLTAGSAVSEQYPDPRRDLTAARTPARADGPMSAHFPRRVDPPARTRQLLTITSRRWDANYAYLRAWRKRSDGSWRRVRGPFRVRLGYGGWAPRKRRQQNTGTTPAGVFALPYAFGRVADPGTRMRYRRFDRNDWWPYEPRDPATYNIWQGHRSKTANWRPTWAERLMSYRDQYALAAVVAYNLPRDVFYSKRRRQWVTRNPVNTSKGGGIFLHVNGSGLTAGCVSMPRSDMRRVLRWLRPAARARVAMGPRRFLAR